MLTLTFSFAETRFSLASYNAKSFNYNCCFVCCGRVLREPRLLLLHSAIISLSSNNCLEYKIGLSDVPYYVVGNGQGFSWFGTSGGQPTFFTSGPLAVTALPSATTYTLKR